jgi:carboxymethylenebutenolidase
MKASRGTSWRARAGVLTTLAVLAGSCGSSEEEGYADRMAREHAGDRPVASEAAEGAPAAPVVEETVAYATVEGRQVNGFLARPEGDWDGGPALIVIHEWWGLNDNIRSMARRWRSISTAARSPRIRRRRAS